MKLHPALWIRLMTKTKGLDPGYPWLLSPVVLTTKKKYINTYKYICVHMGVSLNGGTSISHPKMITFSRKTHGVVGYYHFRKPPYIFYAAINSNKYRRVTAQLINWTWFSHVTAVWKTQPDIHPTFSKTLHPFNLRSTWSYHVIPSHQEKPLVSWKSNSTPPMPPPQK